MGNDYGYNGKGDDGYAHYMLSHETALKNASEGSRGQNQNSSPTSGSTAPTPAWAKWVIPLSICGWIYIIIKIFNQ